MKQMYLLMMGILLLSLTACSTTKYERSHGRALDRMDTYIINYEGVPYYVDETNKIIYQGQPQVFTALRIFDYREDTVYMYEYTPRVPESDSTWTRYVLQTDGWFTSEMDLSSLLATYCEDHWEEREDGSEDVCDIEVAYTDLNNSELTDFISTQRDSWKDFFELPDSKIPTDEDSTVRVIMHYDLDQGLFTMATIDYTYSIVFQEDFPYTDLLGSNRTVTFEESDISLTEIPTEFEISDDIIDFDEFFMHP